MFGTKQLDNFRGWLKIVDPGHPSAGGIQPSRAGINGRHVPSHWGLSESRVTPQSHT